ncbi:MAG: LysR family glycine cleavage system transcriptional activator [Myxococcota bacterium]|jgi:LysR family glycine cleavage system transcriptional activator
MDRPPDLMSIACFDAAARAPSFRAAAASVALSTAAFSDRIRRLEDDLGARLFDRTTRSVALTPAGQRLVPHARALLADARACRALVQATDTAVPYTLTLGTRFELGLSWLVPALPVLGRERPERTLHLSFGSGRELLDRLRRAELDALVSSSRLVDPGLDYVPLHPEHYVFVGSPALLATQPLDRPEQALGHTLLDTAPDLPLFRYHQDARDHDQPLVFASHEYLGAIAAVRLRALGEAGVGVLPEYFVRADLAAGRLVELFPEVRAAADTFRLVWRRGHRRSAELTELGQSLARIPLA